MDGRWFDDLARELSRGASRRRVLQAFAAGGLLRALARPAAAAGQQDQPPPLEVGDANRVQGTCEELDARIRRGVRSAAGDNAGLAGATEPNFRVQRRQPYRFAWVRSPRRGERCLAGSVTIDVTAAPGMFRLDWEPRGAADPAGCQAEVRAWVGRIEKHERDHYRAALAIAADHQAEHQAPKDVRSCGTDQARLVADLETQIKAAEEAIFAALATDWTAYLDAFHEHVERTTPAPSCQTCCPAGTTCPAPTALRIMDRLRMVSSRHGVGHDVTYTATLTANPDAPGEYRGGGTWGGDVTTVLINPGQCSQTDQHTVGGSLVDATASLSGDVLTYALYGGEQDLGDGVLGLNAWVASGLGVSLTPGAAVTALEFVNPNQDDNDCWGHVSAQQWVMVERLYGDPDDPLPPAPPLPPPDAPVDPPPISVA